MATNFEKQQQNTVISKKTNENLSNTLKHTTNQSTTASPILAINSDLLLELQRAKLDIEIVFLAHKNFITTIVINVKISCTKIYSLAHTLYQIEMNHNRKNLINDIANCLDELINYSNHIASFDTSSVNSS